MRCCLAIGPRKSCGRAERAAEHADVGGQGGGERAEPAERRPANGVAQSDDQQRIGDAVGELVVERPDRRFLAALDRHHAVQEIADQPGLDRSAQPIRPIASGLNASSAAPTAANMTLIRRDLVGRDAGSGEKRRRGLGPSRRPRRNRAPVCFEFGHGALPLRR